MKYLIRVGKPTHLKVDDSSGIKPRVSWTACGIIGTPSHDAAYDPRDVDCLNCQRTKAYQQALNGDKA